ncbi:hypothetical protein RJ55_06750 [Drechmeria coniospora]|nr:hypothetical protein RJ55_06750 [Drechmeria coniospora]
MSADKGQFEPVQDPQSQDLPGPEKNLHPTSEPTKLEGKDQFHEYRAAHKLEGCKAFITGGDSGIGRSVALLFAREGADVTIVYLPEEEEDAQETKRMVQDETCEDAIKQHVDKFDKIHALFNNASKQLMCEDLKEINLEDVESTFRSNIIQMFAITKFALKHMEKGGSIINTTSTVAFRGSDPICLAGREAG